MSPFPRPKRHSPPALADDDIFSIFLRIPPDDPARFVRASLICKAWRRILTSPDFCRLYREFHGTPPMLGFVATSWSQDMEYGSRFIPTTAFRLKADPDFFPNWKALDSRHGRILVGLVDKHANFTGGYFVWDPITNGRWGIPPPPIYLDSWNTAVLCAKEHCDHLGCHGPPFLVAMAGSDLESGTTSACVYSSESGVWSDIITLKHPDQVDYEGRSILVGNTLYFPFVKSYRVLQYKLGEQKLSVIDVPDKNWDDESLVFISAKDGVLEFAGWRGTSLSLWSTEAGALAWTQRKVINLEKLLPPRAFEPKPHGDNDYNPYLSANAEVLPPRAFVPKPHGDNEYKPYLSAYAEGAVFLSTIDGLFTVDLNSGRTKKVAEVEMAHTVIPWISFYTLDHARRMRPLP